MTPPSPNQARFFVALLPPAELQSQVTAIKQEVWQTYQSKAALKSPPHITLQPPFLWDEADVERLKQHLAHFAQGHPPVPVTLSGFGAFPPRVIYVDVVREGNLMTIQPALMDYLAETLGIVDKKSRNRRFAPHMTVAFRDFKPATFRQAWPEFKERAFFGKFMAENLTLLKHDGQKWQVFSGFPFSSG
jgi:2'-5' RNA ligase